MAAHSKKTFLGLIAAAIMSLFTKNHPKPTTKDLQKIEFKTSTRLMGIRFTEKIRNVFRFRWIKKH